ncbi:hypothetical protein ACYPKM_05050 [Pseudomonas aeruginosa]
MNHKVKKLRMLAALWGCGYPADREFDTTWEMDSPDSLRLVNAADDGILSFYLEGLLVHYAIMVCQEIPVADLPMVQDLSWEIRRADWSRSTTTSDDWDRLREELYAAFYGNGRGFYASDLKFVDEAIAHMKEHNKVVACSCDRLVHITNP